MSDETDRRFAVKIRSALDDDLTRLDPETVKRLRAARHAALNAIPVRRRITYSWSLPAGAVAAMLAAVTVYMLWPQSPPSGPMVAAGPDDADILIQSGDRLELYRDLEFYRWLAANDLPS